jgi:hypothetical protein
MSLDKYYDYFMKKYMEHYKLFYPLKTTWKEVNKIALHRINYISKKLLKNQEIQFDNASLNSSDESKYVKDSLIKDSLIKAALNFKTNTAAFPRIQNLINYHGRPLSTVQIVPENCVIIILTPLGRLGLQIEYIYESSLCGLK